MEIVIEDRFEGSGKHQVDTFFHLAPGADVRLENGKALIGAAGRTIVLECAANAAPEIQVFRGEENVDGAPIGWHSPRYGSLVPTNTVRFRQSVEFPLSNRFSVRWG
jgi:hypothetical protein